MINKNLTILGIETSCDETAAAVLKVENGYFNIISNVIASQVKIHKKYGGIVPEVAARKQVEAILPVIEKAINKLPQVTTNYYKLQKNSNKVVTNSVASLLRVTSSNLIDIIAVTTGPGLISSLIVGVEVAKVLSFIWQKPVVSVNHLEGHIYANFLPQKICKIKNQSRIQYGTKIKNNSLLILNHPLSSLIFPILCLIVSGGHTQLVLMKDHLNYQVIGETQDDAAGECFDKVGKLLKIGYPGGPIIERLAKKGNPKKFDFPKPLINSKDFNFSFSGLKTAVLYSVYNQQITKNKKIVRDICASVQQAIIDVLVEKTIRATKKLKVKTILLSGGVAANKELRKQLKLKAQSLGLKFFAPAKNLCTDNAAMIAIAGYFHTLKKNFTSWQKLKADPNLRL